jgi:hypothetical protein
MNCGYCCIYYDVIILKPGINLSKLRAVKTEDVIQHKRGGECCPHLEWLADGKANCKIHHFKIYKKTPCFSHSQIERNFECNCRMGEYIWKQGRAKEIRKEFEGR